MPLMLMVLAVLDSFLKHPEPMMLTMLLCFAASGSGKIRPGHMMLMMLLESREGTAPVLGPPGAHNALAFLIWVLGLGFGGAMDAHDAFFCFAASEPDKTPHFPNRHFSDGLQSLLPLSGLPCLLSARGLPRGSKNTMSI